MAQNNLGICYEQGYGVEQSHTEAVKWYRKAAEQGYAMAQLSLGESYYNGEGVEEDRTEAVKWFRKAAEQGNELAKKNLAFCYENEQGMERSYSEGGKPNLMAANPKSAEEQYIMGKKYEDQQSYSEAARWYRKAAEQGHAKAQYKLAVYYSFGIGVKKNLEEGTKWMKKSIDQELRMR